MRIHRFPPIGALILLAALAITSGPGAWASDDPRAVVYGDEDGEENNPTCAWLGQQQGQTWNELKVDEAPNGTHDDQASSDNPGGSGELVLTISDSDGKVFDWSSNIGVDAVVVKGGNRGSNVYFYAPDEATADTRLRSPDNTQGNVPQISHISVCYDEEQGGGQGGGEDPPQNEGGGDQGGGEDPPQNQGGDDQPQDQGESNERPQDDGQQESGDDQPQDQGGQQEGGDDEPQERRGQQESGDDQPQDQSGQQEGGSNDGDSNDRGSDEPTERTPQDESESGGGDGRRRQRRRGRRPR